MGPKTLADFLDTWYNGIPSKDVEFEPNAEITENCFHHNQCRSVYHVNVGLEDKFVSPIACSLL